MKFEVVFIDDEEDVFEIIEEFPIKEGIGRVAFQDPRAAIKYIRENSAQVCLVFCDFNMPEMTGLEVRAQMIEDGLQEIPFLIVTGFYTAEMAKDGMELSVGSFVKKPFQMDEVEALFEKFGAPRKEQIEDEIEMIQGMMEEIWPMMEEIETYILDLDDDHQTENSLNGLFRILHTIKGTTACLGLKDISHYAHCYEDFVTVLKSKGSVVEAEVDVLLHGFDRLGHYLKIVQSTAKDSNIPEEELEVYKNFKFDETVTKKASKAGQESEGVESQKEEKNVNEKLSVELKLLDEFMELSGEITVMRNTLTKVFRSIEESFPQDQEVQRFGETLNELYKITSGLQGKVSEMRKVPLKNIFKTFIRPVRDVSKKLKKKVDFSMIGETLLIDTQLARLFNKILIHVIRNSIDHGIEAPERRAEIGKDETGTLSIEAIDAGEGILLKIMDDGNGIDKNRLIKKGLETGLIMEDEVDLMSDKKIFDLIFAPGLSTAEVVSDVSGRGVGMDMVKSSVQEMHGTIEIESELGKGTTFHIYVPYPKTVLIASSLKVEIAQRQFVIFNEEISEVVSCSPQDENRFNLLDGKMFFRKGEQLIPLITIHSMIKKGQELEFQREILNREDLYLVVLKVEGLRFGLIVDKIFDLEEVVKRPLGQILGNIELFNGVSLMSSGEMSLILNAKGLAESKGLAIEEEEIELSSSGDNQARGLVNQEGQYLAFSLNGGDIYGIELDMVKRVEKLSTSQLAQVGDHYIYNYNNIPIIILETLGWMGHKSDKNLLENEAISILVVENENVTLGLVIEEIHDIFTSETEINETVVDREQILGVVRFGKRSYSIINHKLLVDYSLKSAA